MGSKISLEFQDALKKKRILPFQKGRMLVKKELFASADDLGEAEDRFRNKKFKYATINAYYSMFHSARAFLYSRNYREKSHYFLLVALQALFVENGLIEEKLIKDFHDAMILREGADYHGEFSKEGAALSLESAKEFLRTAKSILKP